GASWADATELAQETMIEAFRSWSAIRYPKAWVRTVAGRKLHHRIFSVQERSTETVPEPSPVLLPVSPTVEWEQQHEALRLISLLPLQQRQAMAWTFDDSPPTETAEAPGLDPATVRQTLHRARAKLADLLRTQRGEGSCNA